MESKKEITPVLKEIGIGPSMYLLFIKGLRNLFLILTIINIPILYLYASGHGASKLKETTDVLFGSYNNGNLGYDNFAKFHYFIWDKN